MNTVIRICQVAVQGNVAIAGQSPDFTARITNATIWVQVQIDPRLQPKPQVLALQLSLGDCTAGGNLCSTMENLFPSVAALFLAGTLAYRIAGAINHQSNAAIISTINSAINNIGGSVFSQSESTTDVAPGLPITTPALVKLQPTAFPDLSRWMSNTQIQAITLLNLEATIKDTSRTHEPACAASYIS